MKDLKKIQNILFSTENHLVQIRHFCLFQFSIWIFHLIIISIVSFFHLVLNHSIGTIAEWISERGWQLILVTKTVIFVSYYQYYKLRYPLKEKFKYYLQSGMMIPRTDFLTVTLFSLLCLIFLGNLQLNSGVIFNPVNLIFSAIGNLSFFAFDFIFVVFLNILYPLDDKTRRSMNFWLSLIFFLGTKATFQYEIIHVSSLYFYTFFTFGYFSTWRRENWSLPLMFLVVVLLPLNVFCGFDPVWLSQYSFLSCRLESLHSNYR